MASQTQIKILVADDVVAERLALRAALEEAGYVVVEAADGIAAIECAHTSRPDLVILDTVLPKMNGTAVCRALRGLWKDKRVPVLMVSGRVAPNVRIEALRSGADDFLGKPIEPRQLRSRVSALLKLSAGPAGADAKAPPAAPAIVPSPSLMPSSSPAAVGWAIPDGTGSGRVTPGAPAREVASTVGTRTVAAGGQTTAAAANLASKPSSLASTRPLANEPELLSVVASSDASAEDGLFARLPERVCRRFTQEFARAKRFSDPLACLAVGFDASGSQRYREFELALLSKIAGQAVRHIDLTQEVEPDGLVVLLPNTHFAGALVVAERFVVESQLTMANRTVGVGVAFFPSADVTAAGELVDMAEVALRVARGDGRGRICLYQHQRYIYTPEIRRGPT